MQHDKEAILSTFTVNKDKSVTISKDTKIQVPAWFKDKDIYVPEEGGIIRCIGSFAFVQGDTYAICEAPCMINLLPMKEDLIDIDGEPYIELSFYKGDKMVQVMSSTWEKLRYTELLQGYLLRGKIPWYLDYEDVVELFLKGHKYAGLLLESRPETIELLHSLTAMQEDRKTLIRALQIKNPKRNQITYVAKANVAFGATTGLTKITGSYQSAGLDDALIKTTKKLSATEKILRDIPDE